MNLKFVDDDRFKLKPLAKTLATAHPLHGQTMASLARIMTKALRSPPAPRASATFISAAMLHRLRLVGETSMDAKHPLFQAPLRVHLTGSSNLRAVSYDTASQALTVEFLNATVYRYARVPYAVYAGLVRASSHGSYFARHIRNQYSFRKLK